MGKNPDFYLSLILSSCWALLSFGQAEVIYTGGGKEQVEGYGSGSYCAAFDTLFLLQVLCNRLRSQVYLQSRGRP